MSADKELHIAVEDRFIIVKLWDEHSLLPLREMENLADWMASYSASYKVLCDARDLRSATAEVGFDVSYDTIEGLHLLDNCSPDVICYASDTDYISEVFGPATSVMSVRPGPVALNYMGMDVNAYSDYWTVDDRTLESEKDGLYEIVTSSPVTRAEWEFLSKHNSTNDLARRYGYDIDEINSMLQLGSPPSPNFVQDLAALRVLDNHIAVCAHNSLLTEYAIQ